MSRRYTLGKRAEQQAETRRKIVEAAVDLHTQVGPARTTISMVAERAGVQRHTFYAHFPDDRSLLLACSGLALERDPFPEASVWRGIGDRRERLRTGLDAIYAYYERNAQLTASVLRDAEASPLVGEIVALRMGPLFAEALVVLGDGMSERQRALLQVAISYFTWRTLTRESALTNDAATETMASAVLAAG
jgi:AcrR family transcriptional regulator